MIFMVRQLAEKAIEHQIQQHLIFTRPMYDSVPREALWVEFRKLEVEKLWWISGPYTATRRPE